MPEASSREATNRPIKDSRTSPTEVAILEVVVRDASINSSRDRHQEPLSSPQNFAPLR